MIINRDRVKLGKGYKIDRNALLGYKPLRKIKEESLKIGLHSTFLNGSVVYLGSTIGKNLILAHNSVIREGNQIGDNVSIWCNSVVDYNCRIGNNVKIHCNVYIAQFTEIEDDVFIGPGTVTANDMHPGCKYSKKCLKGPLIKKGAKIGSNVTINPYVVIGENVLIGSGSVVTMDIPKNCVAYGNPAKVKNTINNLKCTTRFTNFPYKK